MREGELGFWFIFRLRFPFFRVGSTESLPSSFIAVVSMISISEAFPFEVRVD